MENVKKTSGKGIAKTMRDVFSVRMLAFTSLMAALSMVLSEVLKFPIPIMPSYIKFDFSDVPALLASLTMGPVSGVFVCLVKNVFGFFTTSTGGVGELSNFILSVSLVLPAGLITYKSDKISRAIIGCSVGAVFMALISIPSNYFLVYPAYSLVFPMDVIIGMYQKILPSVNGLLDGLLIFNMPFTFAKGACAAIISIILYKKLRPIFNSIFQFYL